MTTSVSAAPATHGASSVRYVAPFVAFLVLLFAAEKIPVAPAWEAPIRLLLLAIVCFVCWPREISLAPRFPWLSVGVGLVVFVIWIAPELFIPGYRSLPLFSNSIVGHTHSSLPPAALRNSWVLSWRTVRAALIVPPIEELFWRAWLMRWLIDRNFARVPMGTYAAGAFWMTAILFASEHGPYWEVGLIAGIIYNAWVIRTKSIADCVVAHAITNLALSLYVIAAGQWQYWQ